MDTGVKIWKYEYKLYYKETLLNNKFTKTNYNKTFIIHKYIMYIM